MVGPGARGVRKAGTDMCPPDLQGSANDQFTTNPIHHHKPRHRPPGIRATKPSRSPALDTWSTSGAVDSLVLRVAAFMLSTSDPFRLRCFDVRARGWNASVTARGFCREGWADTRTAAGSSAESAPVLISIPLLSGKDDIETSGQGRCRCRRAADRAWPTRSGERVLREATGRVRRSVSRSRRNLLAGLPSRRSTARFPVPPPTEDCS